LAPNLREARGADSGARRALRTGCGGYSGLMSWGLLAWPK
jgi:hypothetical protein